MLGNVAKHGDWPITARVRHNLLYIYILMHCHLYIVLEKK